MSGRGSGGGTRGLPAISGLLKRSDGEHTTIAQLLQHMLRIVTFVVIAILVYQPLFGGKWINHPAGGWDEGHTADSWDTYRWDWDWIDCTYFAMVTMTTVGYGDMPTLRQEMRIFTIFFGVLGVVFVASSITVIADFFSEQARKRFIARQRILLKDAHKAAELVRKQLEEEEGEDGGQIASPAAAGACLTGVGRNSSPPVLCGSQRGGSSPAMVEDYHSDKSPPPSPAPPSPPLSPPEPAAAAATGARARGTNPVASAGSALTAAAAAGAAAGAGAAFSEASAPPSPPQPGAVMPPLSPAAGVGAAWEAASSAPSTARRRTAAAHTPRHVSLSFNRSGAASPACGSASDAVVQLRSADGSPPPSPPASAPKIAPHPSSGVKPNQVAPIGKHELDVPDGAGTASGGSSSSSDAVASGDGVCCGRGPNRQFLWKVLKALRPTGAYFGLCILLGEIENAQIEGCEGFGSGWACGFAGSCEGWKSQGSRDYCWSWIDELYFGVVTYMTIGFGDVSAHTKAGKLMGTFIVVMGVFCFTTLLAELNDIKQAKRLGAEKTLRQRLDELQEVIEQDDDGKVTPEEYIIFNLKKMGKIDDETLDLLRDQFKALDADGSGELDADDIAMLATAAKSMESDANATPGGAPASARGSLRR